MQETAAAKTETAAPLTFSLKTALGDDSVELNEWPII